MSLCCPRFSDLAWSSFSTFLKVSFALSSRKAVRFFKDSPKEGLHALPVPWCVSVGAGVFFPAPVPLSWCISAGMV